MIEAALGTGRRDWGDGSWVGFLSYGLARWIEPASGVADAGGALPLAEFHRIAPGGTRGEPACDGRRHRPVLRSESGRGAYVGAVERTLEYIRAGDIYQANIAHRLAGRFSGRGGALFARLSAAASPRHGMYYESAPLADGTRVGLVSLSPELFLSFDARTRRLATRPMKGTRPWGADPAELRDAEKDRAELAMIVDLMRNDLGRVCEFGSVRVERAREIERHAPGAGGVLQATATVSGVVREGVGAAEILRATFPPGSVTGTPKIRAMQVIGELEGFDRGPYCGCIGRFEDDGSFELAVAIRTGVIVGSIDEATGEFEDAEFSYCVGAGVVADSDPAAEWDE
ncbi:MAG TPA: anthranilate synthase component I family protein, partial [Phycisphaerales bacterium]|nr:anthranilate synthase component I family protein [Phycisphaerales bacterium]